VRPTLRRVAAWLAGAWAGLIGAISFVAAPILFAVLPRADAGRVAARLFAAVFDLPFQRHKSWSALREALVGTVASRRPRPYSGSVVPLEVEPGSPTQY
jgi:hypothetical protein